MMGNAHKDSKIFLAYDMDSRLIACKHLLFIITNKSNNNK